MFGSTARGEAGAKSDLDIMADIDPGRPSRLVISTPRAGLSGSER
ncbi:MAG: nucleotidyltransferase domain-containing protein [Caulobacteraceae bacterium]